MYVCGNARIINIRSRQCGVRNHVTAEKLATRGMDLGGYGTTSPKIIGMRVKICAPGHRFEHTKAIITKTRGGNQALVEFLYKGGSYQCWFKFSELREVA